MQLVIGAGPVGRHIAAELVALGEDVVLASRSGAGAAVRGTTRLALDATDPQAVEAAARGAAVIYNAVNPPAYHRWPELWPPVAAALLTAAEHTGAVLATVSNLYPYGPVDSPMVEGIPDAATESKGRVRAHLWADALAAHQAGRARVVEVRASDYMGAGVGSGGHIPRHVPAILAGKRSVSVIGATDQPHSQTDVLDVARAIVAVANDDRGLGRVWHAPTNPAKTQAEAIADLCRAVGREPVRVTSTPPVLLALAAPFVPFVRELRNCMYQFDRPFVVDSTAIEREFSLAPTPWDEVCARTVGQGLSAGRTA